MERKYSSAAELKKITAAFGEWNDIRAAVFTPGKPTVIGALNFDDFGASHSGGSGDFHWEASWYGDLSPDMKLHFGIALPVPDEICEIVVSSKDVKPR